MKWLGKIYLALIVLMAIAVGIVDFFYEEPTIRYDTSRYKKSYTDSIEKARLSEGLNRYLEQQATRDEFHSLYSDQYESTSTETMYEYGVAGSGPNGSVWGSVSVTEDGGDGVIYDDNDNEITVTVEWSGYGTLNAYGDDGEFYELETN